MSYSAAQDRFSTFAWFMTETRAALKGLVSQNTQTQVRDAMRCGTARRSRIRPPIHGPFHHSVRLTDL